MAISFAVATSIHETPRKLWEASKFVLLSVHFIRHFARPILPRVRELVPGFTICLYKQPKIPYNHVFSSPIKPQTQGKNFPLFLPYVSSPRKQLLDIVLGVLIFRNVTFLTFEISPTRVISWRNSKWCVYFCFLFYFGGGPYGVRKGSPWTRSVVGVRGPGVSVFGLPQKYSDFNKPIQVTYWKTIKTIMTFCT